MKKFGTLITAAILGSAITFGMFSWIGPKQGENPVRIEYTNTTPAASAFFKDGAKVAPFDFSAAAEIVMPTVVHIRSTQTRAVRSGGDPRQRQIPDPFRDFFGPFFEERRDIQPQPRMGTGSGVIINENGYIVTNNHVIDGADDVEVTLHNNRSYKAKVIGTDPQTDLALIRIKEKGLPYLSFTDSDVVKVGEWVMAVGNPFNLNSTVTAGIVSAKARNINILRTQDNAAIEAFIQTDAAVNPGNSGGALVNLEGGLIGINTAIASPTRSYSGYSFAIPSNIVSKVVEDLLKFGVVQRGWLGVMIRSVDNALAREHDLKVTEGVWVDSLVANSAAADAGIKRGDVIIKVDGISVKSSPELMEIIGRKRPGDRVPIVAIRKGKEREFMVTLKNREGSTEFLTKLEEDILNILGIELEELGQKTLRKLDLGHGVRVKKISPGVIRKHTDMRDGFIIVSADGKPIKSAEDLIKTLEGKKGGVLLEGVYEDYPGTYYYGFGI